MLPSKIVNGKQSFCTMLEAVSGALQYVVNGESSSNHESLDGFLAMTDSIIHAIKIANPTLCQDIKKRTRLEAVSINFMNTIQLYMYNASDYYISV